MAKSQKGSAFEREICQHLSLWWTNRESDSVFWRTAGSGARATVRGRKGKQTRNQSGDICATDPIGQPFLDVFSLELKRGYPKSDPIELISALDATNPMFYKWITQAEESRINANAHFWMLITKKDRKRILVNFPYQVAVILKDELDLDLSRHSHIRIYDPIFLNDIWIMELYTFLKLVKPDHIRKMPSILSGKS